MHRNESGEILKIISVVGARPNFMKIAPFCRAIDTYNSTQVECDADLIIHLLVHTGQHYDDEMSQVFFEELGIPHADINLGVGSGSPAQQVGKTMVAFEEVCEQQQPDLVVVVGDVNATLACSVTAKKLGITVAHIEAGLRSGDRTMPEEINRLVTDSIADILFAPDRIAQENLYHEGHDKESVHFVGNIMIDTLDRERQKAEALSATDIVGTALLDNQLVAELNSASLAETNIITLHRPSNVDDKDQLTGFVQIFLEHANQGQRFLWPVHPRTLEQLKSFGLLNSLLKNLAITLTRPLSYHELLKLNRTAKLFITDSGGLQEECCVLGTPCLTLRDSTERPVTLREYGGTNLLVGVDPNKLNATFETAFTLPRRPFVPELWDGHTAERIVNVIAKS